GERDASRRGAAGKRRIPQRSADVDEVRTSEREPEEDDPPRTAEVVVVHEPRRMPPRLPLHGRGEATRRSAGAATLAACAARLPFSRARSPSPAAAARARD